MQGKQTQHNPYLVIKLATWLLLFGVFMGTSLTSPAYSKNNDSLRAILDTLSADSLRISTLYKLSWNYMFSAPDTARQYARSMMELAGKTDDKPSYGNGLNLLGISHDVEGRYDSSLYYFLTFLAHAQEIEDTKTEARATNNLCIVYQNI